MYGHKVEACPKQLEAVEVNEEAATKLAECVEAGGGSFGICGIDVHNRYARLTAEDNDEEKKPLQKKSWEDWRTHYQNLPALPPAIAMHNSLIRATRKAIWKLALTKMMLSLKIRLLISSLSGLS